ncbi:hypothetical protein NE236_21170 [Actinoallomurus purpureus]|uniref:hypothetical protein n=1 Tax=Actinoallomurus purpureus TaxID=478114 RepID=UPI0020937311|nr:hypothetical protein [Actinoallomurus purpureus]MCO6007493.1 hypothetical protein [Actinoallomurus purpureus]
MEPSSPAQREQVAAALRQISAGFAALADAISADPAEAPAESRYRSLISEWGERGLTRAEASALFRKHGFSPQAAGGWARGDWLEVREDGRRYLTDRSLHWLTQEGASDDSGADD